MGILIRPLVRVLLTLVLTTITASLSAEETNSCPIKVVPKGCVKTESGENDWHCSKFTNVQEIIFGPGDKRGSAILKSEKCTVTFTFQHGNRNFSCAGMKVRNSGNPPYAITEWSASTGNKEGLSFSRADSISESNYVLPTHTSLRQKILVPGIIEEGWHQAYPSDIAFFLDFYPREFTKIGPISKVKNDWFEISQQTLIYKTMKGQLRSAVTGQAKIDCLKIDFIAWQSESEAPQAEQLMETLLSDIRLEYPQSK